MGQFLGENIPYLVKDSSTQISLPATYLGQPTRLLLGGQGYKLNSALVCNLSSGGLDTGSLAANTLYYVYAAVSGGNVILEASLNGPSVGPTGFTQWRQIGRFRTLSGSAAVADVVNNVSGNGGRDESQMVTEWQTYSPTMVGFGTPSSVTFAYARDGSDLLVKGIFVVGTPTGVTAQIPLPSGLTARTSSPFFSTHNVGRFTINATGTNNDFILFVTSSTPTVMNVGITDNATYAPFTAANGSTVSSAGNGVWIEARIPIVEWTNLFS